MKLSIGIVGLPNVGKSTLFTILTKNPVTVANYPFATIDPNVGVVSVPDERLDKLAEMSRSKKVVPAIVEFFDIAGLVKGASEGQGLGNQFLSHIRDVQAIVHVVRCFKDDSIIHVDSGVDPLRDIDTITTELILKDLETIKRRREKLDGEARTGDKNKIKELEVVKRIEDGLNKGTPVRILGEVSEELVVREMMLLTAKPQLFLLNGNDGDISEALREKIVSLQGGIGHYTTSLLVLNLGESRTEDLSPLIQKAYELLGLISFFTTGEDETRAWTIGRGMKAPEAAGVIHSDFEKKFIRAEVINWERLLEAGSWSAAKQKGWLRLEGKDYLVQDGDVMEIRHG